MNCKITNPKIQKSDFGENDVFVFGSNENGDHAGGAAYFAKQNFGAIQGKAYSIQGQSYAIATLDKQYQKVDTDFIRTQILTFESYVKERSDLHFHITAIGCGIAGFEVNEIAPLFKGFENYENVSLPQEFIDVIINNH